MQKDSLSPGMSETHAECSSPGPDPWVPELGDLDLSHDDGWYEKNCPRLAPAPFRLAQDDSPS